VRKLVEDQEGVGRGQEGPEEVGKAVGEGGRSGRTWESNGTLQGVGSVSSSSSASSTKAGKGPVGQVFIRSVSSLLAFRSALRSA